MEKLREVRRSVSEGGFDHLLKESLGQDPEKGRKRIESLLAAFAECFDVDDDQVITLCSAPGRTEIGGNHTDHQHGRVLAAAVNVDFLACAALNGTNQIRFQSEGWPLVEVTLDRLDPIESEKESTAALVRGMASECLAQGYEVKGFDVYATSDVLPGSGLSSSAACEVLLGVIENHLFCQDQLDPVTVAQMSQRAENQFFGKPCGLMDQTASSVGGAITIDFQDPASPVVESMQVDLNAEGYALCIIDSGASHAQLTGEYSAIPAEMRSVAQYFGKEVLREVPEEKLREKLASVRKKVGDRAILRALHFYADNDRVLQQANALREHRFDDFLGLVKESGRSSWELLQNVTPQGGVEEQAMALALTTAEHALQGRGACRVHGGGFAGTIQAFVPIDALSSFRQEVESVLGEGSCHVMSIRPVGGTVLC